MTAPITLKVAGAVVNPTAGRGAAGRALNQFSRLFSERFDGPVAFFSPSGAATASGSPSKRCRDGADIVAAVGGDGTLHEVANALLSVPARKPLRWRLSPSARATISPAP